MNPYFQKFLLTYYPNKLLHPLQKSTMKVGVLLEDIPDLKNTTTLFLSNVQMKADQVLP